MRKMFLFLIGLIMAVSGCAVTLDENVLTVVTTGAVSPDLLERVRAFAQKELRVPVRSAAEPSLAQETVFQTLEKAAKQTKSRTDVTYIVLAELQGDEHLKVYPESGIGLVNTAPLRTDDAKKFARRVQRMVMRAAAFCFELPPTPDPHCVTRDYHSLADLDCMGMNYSPPWQARYADEAARRGLQSPEGPSPFTKP